MAGFQDLLSGGLLGAAGNVLGGTIDAIAGAVEGKKQRQHDKDMAALNQQNALEQMKVQNEYQVDQWNRENEYNDPSAVAARYRAAGINPRSALGGAATGAGIAGGLSSGPSGSNTGSSSNAMFSTNFAGALGSAGRALLDARLNSSQVRKLDAEAVETEIDNETRMTSNLLDIDLKVQELESKKSQKNLTDKQIEEIDGQLAFWRKQRDKMQSDIEVNNQAVEESKSRVRKMDKEGELIDEQTSQLKEQRTAILEGLIANNYLKGAQESYYLELADKVGKDIELISKDLENYDINLYARLAQMGSQELRGWASVLNSYLEARDNKQNADKSAKERSRMNRILLLRYVLPYLLK